MGVCTWLAGSYPIFKISAVVSSSSRRRLERSYPRSASSRNRVSSFSFFTEPDESVNCHYSTILY